MINRLLFLIIVSLNLMSCGSGSGGGGAAAIVLNPPSFYETSEYNTQYGLGKIKSSEIYSDGYSGSGVTVAVIDTGVDLDHLDLVNNIASGGYDYVDNDSDANPNGQGNYMSHGTHVAGIIAAIKNDVGMHGVAYNSKILALRAGTSSGVITNSYVRSSIDRAINQNAKVINASFGGLFDATTADKWVEAHNNDIVTVHSAGNDSNTSPGYDALLPNEETYTALQNTLIAVVATDSNNIIASYSNKCGDAKNWCMAAPGSNIYSTVDTTDILGDGDGYATYNGTSMAAPHVSGAAAVLRSKWPSKTATQVVTILYDTATDLGASGIDAVYGRGLVNLDNAVYAQGILTLYTSSGANYTLNDSSLLVSSILGNALSQSLETAVFDKYKRDYYVNLNSAIQRPTTFKMLDELRYLDSNISFDLDSKNELFANINTGSIQIQKKLNNVDFVFSYKQNPQQVFAFNNNDTVVGLSDQYSLYSGSQLSKINNASLVNIVDNGNITTSLGIVSGYTDLDNKHPINGINLSMLAQPTQNLSLLAQLSQLEEKDTFLSSYFSGAYKTGTAKTNAINLVAKSKLTNGLDFIIQYNKGKTNVASLKDSVIYNISMIDSESYSLALVKKGLHSINDTLFIAVKYPLRVINGDIRLRMANGLNLDDSVSFNDQIIGLTPTGVEKEFTVGYSTDNRKDITIKLLLNHKSNPNHDLSANSEDQVMIKMIKKF